MKFKALIIPFLVCSAYAGAVHAEQKLVVRVPAMGIKAPAATPNPGQPPGGGSNPGNPEVPVTPPVTGLEVAYNVASNPFSKLATYTRTGGEVGEFVSARFVIKNANAEKIPFGLSFLATGQAASTYTLMDNIAATNCKFKTELQAGENCLLYIRYPMTNVGENSLALGLYDIRITASSPAGPATLSPVETSTWKVEPNFQDAREVAANASPDYVVFANKGTRSVLPSFIQVSGDWKLPVNPERLPPMTQCGVSLPFINGQPCQVPVQLVNPARTGVHQGVVTLTYTNVAGNMSETLTIPISATVSN